VNTVKSIHYISHGEQQTGGYFHEKFLAESLTKNYPNAQYKELRQWQHFENKLAHLKLFYWAFKQGTADVNICVARLALPVLLRNLFNKKKVLVVWHYYDEQDGKSKFLRSWYHWLIQFSLLFSKEKLSFVAVAPFWKKYFTEQFHLKQVFLFPNFFEPSTYSPFINTAKKKQIHLGQVSFKNSTEIVLIAEQLSALGYRCYQSTNDPKKVHQHPCYEVVYFKEFEQYLAEMAASQYTLAMPSIREGWNRVAHESLLVGTQVIGFAKGGLADLLQGANAHIIRLKRDNDNQINYVKSSITGQDTPVLPTVTEAVEIVVTNQQLATNSNFLDKFTPKNLSEYLTPILNWVEG
jgi:glycosyltransferase involved in cell wall biosynthesis